MTVTAITLHSDGGSVTAPPAAFKAGLLKIK